MDKKHKPQPKRLSEDELREVTPPGASFDTEAGRTAQGMRPDLGADGGADAGGEAGEEDKTKPEEGDEETEDLNPQDVDDDLKRDGT